MPNKNTFDIKPIYQFTMKYLTMEGYNISVDPFSNNSKLCIYTNDIDPSTCAKSHMDALKYLKKFDDESIDIILFDPPYSPRQISEVYNKLNLSVNMETTQSSFWSKIKDEIKRILRLGGICISYGWNSSGIGLKRGFEINEILIVCHGGQHNDTICVSERKERKQLTIC